MTKAKNIYCKVTLIPFNIFAYPDNWQFHICKNLACDQRCDDQGEDHELEEPHEELARVGDDADGEGGEVVVAQREAAQHARHHAREGEDQQEVLKHPGLQLAAGAFHFDSLQQGEVVARQ